MREGAGQLPLTQLSSTPSSPCPALVGEDRPQTSLTPQSGTAPGAQLEVRLPRTRDPNTRVSRTRSSGLSQAYPQRVLKSHWPNNTHTHTHSLSSPEGTVDWSSGSEAGTGGRDLLSPVTDTLTHQRRHLTGDRLSRGEGLVENVTRIVHFSSPQHRAVGNSKRQEAAPRPGQP